MDTNNPKRIPLRAVGEECQYSSEARFISLPKVMQEFSLLSLIVKQFYHRSSHTDRGRH